MPGIFAGGDFVTGPAMVVEAIAAGRRGALAIDKFLRGDTSPVTFYDRKGDIVPEGKAPEGEDTWEEQLRTETPKLPVADRRTTFDEIELGFPEDIARKEAGRCLRCDLET